MGLTLGSTKGTGKLKNIIANLLSRIVDAWSATPTHDNIPSEKLVKDSLDLKADITPANGATSALRALYIARGYHRPSNTYSCVYNSNTGYYEMNGITDIAEAEMAEIFILSMPLSSDNHAALTQSGEVNIARTLYPVKNKTIYRITAASQFQSNNRIEVYKTIKGGINYPDFIAIGQMFYGAANIRVVDGLRVRLITSADNALNCFYSCVKLEEAYIQELMVNFSFAYCPLLTLASLQYLVTNRNGTTRITITVHSTVWSKLNDADNYPEWNALLVDAVANKYIDFASA